MRYTIKDLKEGKVALINEHHPFVEAVLRLAFPEDLNIREGYIEKYLNRQYLISCGDGDYNVTDSTDLPTQKAFEFMLSYAEETYPKGTRYIDKEDDEVCEVNGEFIIIRDDFMITDGYGGCVYYNGNWAEIVEKPKQEPKQEIKRVDDPTLKVGDKVLGFKFKEGYTNAMDKHLGEVGEVDEIFDDTKSHCPIKLKFKDAYWYYPNKYDEQEIINNKKMNEENEPNESEDLKNQIEEQKEINKELANLNKTLIEHIKCQDKIIQKQKKKIKKLKGKKELADLDTKEAINTIRNYQRWRKGEIDIMPYSPRELSIAFDLLLKFANQKIK